MATVVPYVRFELTVARDHITSAHELLEEIEKIICSHAPDVPLTDGQKISDQYATVVNKLGINVDTLYKTLTVPSEAINPTADISSAKDIVTRAAYPVYGRE